MSQSPLTGIAARARRALDAGKSRDEVVEDLVAGGLSRSTAERFVDRAVAAPSQTSEPAAITAAQAADAGGRTALVSGAFWLSLGSTVTGTTYLLASPGETTLVAEAAQQAEAVAIPGETTDAEVDQRVLDLERVAADRLAVAP